MSQSQTEIYRVDVEITAPVYDTEVTSRVADAATNIFPNAELEESLGEIRGETHSLEQFSDLLHRQEILDTARGEFFSNREGQTFSFALKKQAAFENRVNFSVGEPDELGEIAVQVRVEEPSLEEYVDHVAPPTEDGRPIDS
ncbi:RNA-binding domain-containing protein [Halostagnicola sp. A-GB9-2]|uniref:RNA-binding domain-containing protein n=1 Tax=Halostagnicola sp. A-GB9-2 TaxID=3048066 RepID=UPI0024BF4361|nr:RNA-binding domain-containing protein [Halostagnicola sp. A-GB9-2]MDJ1432987.1 RNA-binding domain-containing protein [Halostagnicola sp. A-GB9-2]